MDDPNYWRRKYIEQLVENERLQAQYANDPVEKRAVRALGAIRAIAALARPFSSISQYAHVALNALEGPKRLPDPVSSADAIRSVKEVTRIINSEVGQFVPGDLKREALLLAEYVKNTAKIK